MHENEHFQSTIADHGCLQSSWHQCAPSCLRYWSMTVVRQPALGVGLPIGDPSTTPTRGVGACHPHPSEFEIGRLTGVDCMLRVILSARSLTQLHAEFNEARGRFHRFQMLSQKWRWRERCILPHLPDENFQRSRTPAIRLFPGALRTLESGPAHL